MEDREFVQRLKQKIEEATHIAIDLEIDQGDPKRMEIDLSQPVAKVIFGSDTVEHAGLARMYSQFAILCLKEKRQVSEEEFLRYLRRN